MDGSDEQRQQFPGSSIRNQSVASFESHDRGASGLKSDRRRIFVILTSSRSTLFHDYGRVLTKRSKEAAAAATTVVTPPIDTQ